MAERKAILGRDGVSDAHGPPCSSQQRRKSRLLRSPERPLANSSGVGRRRPPSSTFLQVPPLRKSSTNMGPCGQVAIPGQAKDSRRRAAVAMVTFELAIRQHTWFFNGFGGLTKLTGAKPARTATLKFSASSFCEAHPTSSSNPTHYMLCQDVDGIHVFWQKDFLESFRCRCSSGCSDNFKFPTGTLLQAIAAGICRSSVVCTQQ